jgi:hypothetical protein
MVRAMLLGEEFFRGVLATIYYLTEADIVLSWQTFRQFSDKEWRVVSCDDLCPPSTGRSNHS